MEKFSKYLIVLPAFLLLIIGCPLDSSIPDAPPVPPKEDPGNYSTILWEQDANGDIQFSTNNPGHKGYAFWAWLTAVNQTSFSKVEVEVTRKNGSINGAQGAVFCLQDENNFLAVLITANDDYAVFTCNSGFLSHSGWRKADALVAGLDKKNTIRVERNASTNTFTVYFNNVQTTTFQYSQFKSGYCGFIAGISTDEQFPQIPADIRFRLVSPVPYYVSNPQPIEAGEINSLTPLLSWDATSGCQSFHLQLGTDSTFQSVNIIDNAAVMTRSFQVQTALEYGKTYFWRVRPRDGDGNWYEWSPAWSFKLTRKIRTYAGVNTYRFPDNDSPAIAADGSLYIHHDGTLFACRPDGTLDWSYETLYFGSNTSPIVAPDGNICFIGGNRDVGNYAKRLFKISPRGTEVWHRDLITTYDYQPVVDNDGTIYVIDSGKITACNGTDGSVAWEFLAPNGKGYYRYLSLSRDGHIYFMDGDKIYCIENGGRKKWEYPYTILDHASPIAIDSKNNIVFVDYDMQGIVRSINQNGILNWTINAGGSDGTSVIGANDAIYVSSGGNIYAINSNGTPSWTYHIRSWNQSSPAIGADGTIFFYAEVSPNSYVLHALDPNGSLKWTYESNANQVRMPIHSPLILNDGTLIYSGGQETAALITECGGLANTAWPRSFQNNQNTGMKSGVAVGAALKSQSVLKATLNRGNAVKAGPKYQQKNQKADICPK